MFSLSRLFILSFSVSLGLLPLQTIQAQNNDGSVIFRPNGSPRTTSGGASRGICSSIQASSPQSAVPITALIPATDVELTTEAHPTIFVRIPDSTSKQAELSLWDENLDGIYQTVISLPSTPGIVSFKLPDSAPPLAIGKRYKWSVAVICDPQQRSRDRVVEGWIQRTKLNSVSVQQLTAAKPLEKVKIYAENKIWYDTLTTLAELKRSHPEDASITQKWQQLLQSVGLQSISQVPVVDCCQAQN